MVLPTWTGSSPGTRAVPGDGGSTALDMTDIPEDLDLPGAGLDHIEMDPFSIPVHADGRRVRFFRSIEADINSIAEGPPAEAQAYRPLESCSGQSRRPRG